MINPGFGPANPGSGQSRIAEMALELMGAEHVSAVFNRLLDAASPETLREVADSFVKGLLKYAGERSYDGYRWANEIIAKVAAAEIERLRPEIEALVRERLESEIRRVKDLPVIREALRQATQAAFDKARSAFDHAMLDEQSKQR